jgi:enamine deaminase RidA (YjgF/YER057c/UK114 family)
MKSLTALAAGAMMVSAPAAAQDRPAVQHYGNPTMNGQRLPFSRAVRVGDILYLSGAIGRGPDGKPPEGIEAQTKATMDDIGETLKLAGLGYDRLFHCTAFLADMKDWPAFNKVYVGYFPDGPLPARSAVGVNGLALGALLEIECQAYAGK